MKDLLENLYYAKLQLENAVKSDFLNYPESQSNELLEIKSLLLSAQFMIRLSESRIKNINHGDLS